MSKKRLLKRKKRRVVKLIPSPITNRPPVRTIKVALEERKEKKRQEALKKVEAQKESLKTSLCHIQKEKNEKESRYTDPFFEMVDIPKESYAKFQKILSHNDRDPLDTPEINEVLYGAQTSEPEEHTRSSSRKKRSNRKLVVPNPGKIADREQELKRRRSKKEKRQKIMQTKSKRKLGFKHNENVPA